MKTIRFQSASLPWRRFLSHRQSHLVEWMDRPDCDKQMLHNTYRYFPVVNRLISRWNSVYLQQIRPCLTHGTRYRLLDVGCGGGDITKNIWVRAKKEGFLLDVTGIDPDPRAIEYARAMQPGDSSDFRFLKTDTSKLRTEGNTYDFVICNHVLHHLSDDGVKGFLDDLSALALRRIICSDIERSTVGYALFSVFTLPFFPKSFIRADGLISIKKSFRPHELRDLLPDEWRVIRQFPFRLLAVLDKTFQAK